MTYRLYCGDCLEVLPTLEAGSVDAVICDLPYGTTQCAWDTVIPFGPMWEQIKRVAKRGAAVVLFGAQPFTSALIMSNPRWFKYDLVWRKVRVTGHLDAKRKPLREHEEVLLFCDGQPTYNPQMAKGVEHVRGPFGQHKVGASTVYGKFVDNPSRQNVSSEFYPRSTIEFQAEMQPEHPTQKPLGLLSYLVRTYTNVGDTVIDFAMGSGTTGVACRMEGRNFIGIDTEAKYVTLAERRIANAQPPLFVADAPAIPSVEQATMFAGVAA
jgi:DNA modification methylase